MSASRTVAVLGPGAVGGMLAVRLAHAGRDVVCVAPAGAVAQIARDGLTLEWEGRTLEARPRAREELDEPVGLLLVCVKAPALAEALRRVRPAAVAAGLVLPLLNGLEHLETLRAALGPRVAAGTIGRLEAYRTGPTHVVQTTPLPLVTLAADDLPAQELAHAVEPLREAGLDVEVGAGEREVLWGKAARLAPLAAVTAASRLAVGAVLADPEWRRMLAHALEEACTVARADGVPVSSAGQWEIIAGMPPSLTTSTARDVAAGRPSELDAIAGALARAGRRLGVPTPTLDELLRRVGEP